MKYVSARILSLMAALACCSCKVPTPPEAEPETPELPAARRLIGRIASAPSGQSFILVQTYTNINLPIGTILTTRGANGRAANIKISGESLKNFSAADLQSGDVEIGDAVYIPNLEPATTATDASEAADSQSIGTR